MAEAKQFSDAQFFVPESAGKYGEEVAGCRTLTFVDEHTFEMITHCGPKGPYSAHLP
jgi:hypothetical protein